MDLPRLPSREDFFHVPEKWRYLQRFSLGQLRTWIG